MFGLFKKKPTDFELEVALAEVVQAEQATRSLARKLLKAQEETDRVLKRMARQLLDAHVRIVQLEEQVADHVEKLETQAEFNDFVAHTGMDGSTEVKKHQCQLAALFAWREKAIAEFADIKGKL